MSPRLPMSRGLQAHAPQPNSPVVSVPRPGIFVATFGNASRFRMEDFMGRGRIASLDDPQYNIIALLTRHLHRFACGLGGHDLVLKVDSRRMALQCVSCPYETPGWTLDDKRRPRTEPQFVIKPSAVRSLEAATR